MTRFDDMSHWFDLDEVPYTARFSRLFIRTDVGGLVVYEASYERPLSESILASQLTIGTPAGPMPVSSASPLGIEFGEARLVVDEHAAYITGLPDNAELRWIDDRGRVRTLRASPQGTATIVLRHDAHRDPKEATRAADQLVNDWMAKCPIVAEQWRDVVAFCWWVLGVNTLRLEGPTGTMHPVVPSKIGYVGLWQWDAYFIAVGLRHGDIDLACEQLDIALGQQRTNGQLPDVVHEHGVLASSEDLPEADLENLRAMSSPSLAQRSVPLTKPPLAALALELVAEHAPEFIDRHLDAALRAQRWWYGCSSFGGHPVYLHPYSSGLDDSPIFDHEAILESPDLTSYLINADDHLAAWLTERGRETEAQECRGRAKQSLVRLLSTWHGERRMFPSLGEDGTPVGSETIVSLMPLLIAGLPAEHVSALRANILDPDRFAAKHPLPTVAQNDPGYSTQRMWRGPVWINTNWLVAHGLRLHGDQELARSIERQSLELIAAFGPCEYFNPDTGRKPSRATTCFGWSAALAIDMAVRLSRD